MAAGSRNLTIFTSLRESGVQHSLPTVAGRRVYKGVTIIKAGLGNRRDRNYYPSETLKHAVQVGQFKGLKAYADHQDSISEEVQPERTIRDMVGVYQNEKFVAEGSGGRVTADLHLFRSSKWLADTIDDLIDLKQADNIGLSINGRGQTVEKQIALAEAESPINVNWVEGFTTLRSADVVTEAGAGGGFQQLLESARGTAIRENTMKRLTEAQKTAIKAAVDANDPEKLQAVLTECGCVAEKAAKGKKKTAPVETPDDEAVSDAETDATEAADELDAAVEEAKRKATEPDEPIEDADDADHGDDEAMGEDAAEDEDDADGADDDAADEVEEAGMGHLPKGAGVIAKGGKGMRVKGMVAPGAGGRVKRAPVQASPQKGRRFGEATAPSAREQKLMEENARLSAQLRVRTTADRARNLLRESAIPEKMRPEILPLMIGKSEDEMRKVVRYHERFIATAIAEASGYGTVEGAGASLRESFAGSGGDVDAMLEGLPRKA